MRHEKCTHIMPPDFNRLAYKVSKCDLAALMQAFEAMREALRELHDMVGQEVDSGNMPSQYDNALQTIKARAAVALADKVSK